MQQVQVGHRSAIRPADWLLVANVDLLEAEASEDWAADPRIGSDASLSLQVLLGHARGVDHVDEDPWQPPVRGALQHVEALGVQCTRDALAARLARHAHETGKASSSRAEI